MSAITVEVTYQERLALPPLAEVTVDLVDVSDEGMTPTIIVSDTLITKGAQVPFDLELSYESDQIDENTNYAVRGEIRFDDEVIFTTNQYYGIDPENPPGRITLTLAKT